MNYSDIDIELNEFWIKLITCNVNTVFSKSSAEGAECTLNAAINPALKGVRDVYYQDCKPKNTHDDARFVFTILLGTCSYSLGGLSVFCKIF